ncbi:MAG TPA: M20/M25/M40 family metallo-hydrolase [Gemmatimonadaceae bacterium]|jgi:acetylornithine deacetylase|nr:M20/M25/M40 family metallo-hydrolase [Gemmatimonadaceae bacterium]
MTDVVSLAAELLSIQSTTGSEGTAVDFVSRWLVGRGWNVTLQEVTRGRANIWASRSGGGVTFSTHLDTVPPYVPPRLEGSRLYGRGSSDAKGIAAAMLVAADRLVSADEKRVELLFVVGEEKGSDGARAANNLGTKSRFLINGEPSESKLASGAKGSLRATIRTRGREAHSAYPHLGRSAIEPMLALLPTLRSLPLPSDPVLGQTTVNIGTIKGGTEANVIPAHAEAEIMFRLVSDVEPIKKMISDWAKKGGADVEFGSHIPAQRFATVPGFETEPVAYTSDIPLLSNWGEPFLFGPGSIHVAHTPDEFIDVDELRASVDTYERLAKTLLAR